MIEISEKFRPRNILIYPPKNTKIFEEFFYDEFLKLNPKTERIYLPIFWTNYYISKNYGQGDLSELQSVLDGLNKNKKYFTIVQYDDNILNDLKDLDILIFCQGGFGNYKDRCYVIPLNCTGQVKTNQDKNILISFVGRKTHPIRNLIFERFQNNSTFFLTDSLPYDEFKQIMCQSVFSLCPRGYGLTSFRICEALQSESIPIYVYDEIFVPFEDKFNFEEIGILVENKKIHQIPQIIESKKKEDLENMINKGKLIYEKFFSFEGCYREIIEILNNNI